MLAWLIWDAFKKTGQTWRCCRGASKEKETTLGEIQLLTSVTSGSRRKWRLVFIDFEDDLWNISRRTSTHREHYSWLKRYEKCNEIEVPINVIAGRRRWLLLFLLPLTPFLFVCLCNSAKSHAVEVGSCMNNHRTDQNRSLYKSDLPKWLLLLRNRGSLFLLSRSFSNESHVRHGFPPPPPSPKPIASLPL